MDLRRIKISYSKDGPPRLINVVKHDRNWEGSIKKVRF